MTSLRCTLGWHRYIEVHTPDSIDKDPYFLRCLRCGHERDKPLMQF